MDTESRTYEQERRPGTGREWYAAHRADVLARLAEPAACGRREQRSAALLVLAFDDDPATVAWTRVARGAGV
jgi:hypothetical protein